MNMGRKGEENQETGYREIIDVLGEGWGGELHR